MNSLAPGTRTPWVIAHRGASADFPENTHPAFEQAVSLPIDAMELDLQLSRDGVPIVWHDRTLKKAGRPLRRVRGLAAAEIARLDAGAWRGEKFAGTAIATLDEVLERYAQKTPLMLEIKLRGGLRSLRQHRKLAETVVRRVVATGLSERVFILSFGLSVLESAMAVAPELRYVLNLKEPPVMSESFIRRIDPLYALCQKVQGLDAAQVQAVHRMNKPVLTYTVNDEATLRRALNAGADGLLSARPAWLHSRLHDPEGAP